MLRRKGVPFAPHQKPCMLGRMTLGCVLAGEAEAACLLPMELSQVLPVLCQRGLEGWGPGVWDYRDAGEVMLSSDSNAPMRGLP